MIAALLMLGSILAQTISIAATRASDGSRSIHWTITSFAMMVASVALMSQALAHGVDLAVAYGVWSGSGIVAATLTGVVVFRDRIARIHVVGLSLLLGGVLLVYGG